MSIDPPRAIRVKTSTGWADLVVQGPPGDPGVGTSFAPYGDVSVDAPDTDLPWLGGPAITSYYGVTGATGTLRSIGAPDLGEGARLSIFNWAGAPLAIQHDVAGGGAPFWFQNAKAGDVRVLDLNRVAEFVYDGGWWEEIDTSGVAPAVPLVTALPASPKDGDVIDFLADAANGVVWRFRYRADADPALPWEFIGGASLFDVFETGEAIGWAYPAMGAAATPRPAVTVPLFGDYLVDVAASAYCPVGSSYALVGANVFGQGYIAITFTQAGAWHNAAGMARTGPVPAQTIVMFFGGFQASAPNGIQYGYRQLKVTPVRVGLPSATSRPGDEPKRKAKARG